MTRYADVVGITPNEAFITRLVGAILLVARGGRPIPNVTCGHGDVVGSAETCVNSIRRALLGRRRRPVEKADAEP